MLMAIVIKGRGMKTNNMAAAFLPMLKDMCTRDIFKITNVTDEGYIFIRTVLSSMTVSGRTAKNCVSRLTVK